MSEQPTQAQGVGQPWAYDIPSSVGKQPKQPQAGRKSASATQVKDKILAGVSVVLAQVW